MVFSIVILLMVGLIAYFHFVQGFFSATLSAIICVIAALIAVSYDETVVNLLLKGKMADIAHSFVLCAIFAITYIALRFLFDAAIPGNVRTPATVDIIGSILMGLVAGIFTTGIFAIAVEMLPFNSTISLMGYSRYPVKESRDVVLPTGGNGQMLDSQVHDELVDNTLSGDADFRAKQRGLWIPVDDIVLDTVYRISDGGSLAGDRTLASVHPDYLQELFGERLGQQDGARRSVLQFPGHDVISIGGVFSADSLPATSGLIKALRAPDFELPKDKKFTSAPGREILIVRVVVHGGATDDEDQIFRYSTGSIHLVAHPTDPTPHDEDYYPIGTLQNAQMILVNKPDDSLFLNLKTGDAAFDAVFLVGRGVIVGDKAKGENKIADGTFISVKRFGLLNLSGETVVEPVTPSTVAPPLFSKAFLEEANLPPAPAAVAQPQSGPPTRPPETPAPVATPTAAPAPVEPAKSSATASATVGATISFAVGCKTDNADDPNVTVAGGTVALKGGNIAVAQINPVDPAELGKGDSQLKELAVPDGYKVVQVTYSTTGNPFGWVDKNGAIQVVDANGTPFKANGVIVKLADSVMLRYDMNHSQFAVPSLSGTPQSTTFLFVVRSGTHLASLSVGDESTPISAEVP